ncbi:MAG TPA: hypothetical protein VGC79_18435, partial [Polyangiaceae bacterium]
MLRRGLWLWSLLCAGAFVACVTNHEALEKKPGGRGVSGAGGTFASAGAPGHRGGSGGEGADTVGHPDDEAPGESVLTIVNGLVDAPRVVLCLAKVDSEGTVTPLGSPLTDDPLEYGQSVVVRQVKGVNFETDGLEPIVIAGELDLIAGLRCDAAIERARAEEALSDGTDGELGQGGAAGEGSGPGVPGRAAEGGSAGEGGGVGEGGSIGDGGSPAGGNGGSSGGSGLPPAKRSALRARGLPALSAGTLNAGRSLVFVANGCLGGATYSGKDEEQYCGAGYTPRQPTASAVLVSLSRQVSADHVALQVVHASLANDQVELRSRPPFPSMATG